MIFHSKEWLISSSHRRIQILIATIFQDFFLRRDDESLANQRLRNNLRSYFSAFAPALKDSQYGNEIWALYESGTLRPDHALTGQVVLDEHLADVDAVLQQVELAIKEDEIRRMCR